MSYVEMGSVLFRGELQAAKGKARFKLTANAINVADTIHFGGGQVSYSVTAYAASKAVVNGGEILSLTLNVPDDGCWIEVGAYSNMASLVRVNGGNRVNRNRQAPNSFIRPFMELVQLNKGIHTVQMVSSGAGTATNSYLVCRYIRPTGGR